MVKRLSDTAAIVATPAFGKDPENFSETVNVRKIDNGYIKRTTTYGEGQYRERETYSADKPNAAPDQGSSMERATEYLQRTNTATGKGAAG